MNVNQALELLDKICAMVPLTHEQHELVAKALDAATYEKEAVAIINQVVMQAPLVRADYKASRAAIQLLLDQFVTATD